MQEVLPQRGAPATARTGLKSGLPIRVIRRALDSIPEFGVGRFVSDTMMVDVRVSELPEPQTGDLIVIGTDSFAIQGEPVRDGERLIWSLDLRPS